MTSGLLIAAGIVLIVLVLLIPVRRLLFGSLLQIWQQNVRDLPFGAAPLERLGPEELAALNSTRFFQVRKVQAAVMWLHLVLLVAVPLLLLAAGTSFLA